MEVVGIAAGNGDQVGDLPTFFLEPCDNHCKARTAKMAKMAKLVTIARRAVGKIGIFIGAYY